MKSMIAVVLGMIASAAVGCSSSSSPAAGPCNENPWQCPAGQVCWPNNVDGTFACLNSGPGAQGSACENSVGTPTCGDGLTCFGTTTSGGACTAYCDNTNPSHGCPSGLTCESVISLTSTQTQFHACVGGPAQLQPGGDDAGTSADASPVTVGGPDSGGADASSSDGSSSSTDSSAGMDSGPDAPLVTGH
ncbi:MAG: hypothetical protein ACREJ3_03665 [Polyangiaceae bacterium]